MYYYEIQAFVAGRWTADLDQPNAFESEDEAQAALESRLDSDPSWAVGEGEESRGYRVRLVGVVS